MPLDPTGHPLVSLRLGGEGQGMAIAQDTLRGARIGHAAIVLGRLRGALPIATQDAQQRQVPVQPAGQAVAAHQRIPCMLASMAATLEANRCLVHASALHYNQADPQAGVFVCIAKLRATDDCMPAVLDCLQLLGGNGDLQACPLARFMRDARHSQIGEDSSEMHKYLVARHVLAQAAAPPLHPVPDLAPDLWCDGAGHADAALHAQPDNHLDAICR